MAVEQSFFDSLYCEEQGESGVTFNFNDEVMPSLEQDLVWDDEELDTLFSKQKESFVGKVVDLDVYLPRKETVEWVLRINSHYGFSASTAILAVSYLDRFLDSLSFQRDKPWMMQLAGVACLSLAAKVEETYVPLLLDLQVGGAKYFFEAKTIQRMELLILSALKWRMNSVTPLCFIDHCMRRLGLKNHLYWEFFRGCANLLLLLISDSRFRWFPPSVLAGATMIHISGEAGLECEIKLLSMLKMSKEELKRCYDLLSDILSNTCRTNKRISDESKESSSISSMRRPILKKARVQEQPTRRLHCSNRNKK